MAFASCSVDVAVPPARFLAVLQDYARYPEFQPDVKSIKVGPREGDRVEVSYAIDARLMLIEYTLEHVQRGPLRIDWRLLCGEVMRHNVGSWTLEPLPGGGTRVTYSIELELGGPMTPGLQRALTEQGLPRMLGNFKERAEKLFAARPG